MLTGIKPFIDKSGSTTCFNDKLQQEGRVVVDILHPVDAATHDVSTRLTSKAYVGDTVVNFWQ